MGTETLQFLNVCVHSLSLKLAFMKTKYSPYLLLGQQEHCWSGGHLFTCIMQFFWLCLEGLFCWKNILGWLYVLRGSWINRISAVREVFACSSFPHHWPIRQFTIDQVCFGGIFFLFKFFFSFNSSWIGSIGDGIAYPREQYYALF